MIRFVKILLFLFPIVINAQSIDSLELSSYSTKASINKQYFKSYFLDTKDFILSPTKWDKKEWIFFAGFTGTTILTISQDKKLYDFFQEQRSNTTDTISKYLLEPWGSGVYSMPTMALFYLQGCMFKNERSKKVAMLGVKSYLLSGVMVQIPKYLFNRHRPYHNDGPNVWDGPFTGDYYKSFFSGHTTSVFAVATIVASEYNETIYVPVISYTIASFSALSRVNDNKHWVSDVFAGAIYGYAIGKLIYNHNNWKINISPYKNSETTGIALSKNF